jgi:hypothetical protein
VLSCLGFVHAVLLYILRLAYILEGKRFYIIPIFVSLLLTFTSLDIQNIFSLFLSDFDACESSFGD